MAAPHSERGAIAIFGAGAVGCWVGGRLAAGGADVVLVGRARMVGELAGGLRTSELDGGSAEARVGEGGRVQVATEAEAARGAAVVLVTVKSAQTQEAGEALAKVLPSEAVVVSLQNGVRNAKTLQQALPGRRVLAAMVPFNVIRRGPGVYHRASEGVLRIEDHAAAQPLLEACAAAQLSIEPRGDMDAVQWGKLVLNLNNAINALSGLPLATELSQRPFRRCLAAAQREALGLLARADVPVAKLTPIPPRWIPRLLDTPDRLFRVLGRRVVAIDPEARSSMWDDLEAGRRTEIDYLQGEIVDLAARTAAEAPVNGALAELVRAAEHGGRRDYTGEELARAIGA